MSWPPRLDGGTSCSPGLSWRGVVEALVPSAWAFDSAVDTTAARPLSAGMTNKWLLLNSVNAFQCRKNSLVKTFAFTLLFFSSSSRCLLHASSLQSGCTADTNTMFFPSGDQIAPSAPVEILVI